MATSRPTPAGPGYGARLGVAARVGAARRPHLPELREEDSDSEPASGPGAHLVTATAVRRATEPQQASKPPQQARSRGACGGSELTGGKRDGGSGEGQIRNTWAAALLRDSCHFTGPGNEFCLVKSDPGEASRRLAGADTLVLNSRNSPENYLNVLISICPGCQTGPGTSAFAIPVPALGSGRGGEQYRWRSAYGAHG